MKTIFVEHTLYIEYSFLKFLKYLPMELTSSRRKVKKKKNKNKKKQNFIFKTTVGVHLLK
jgi:hypothetical protein